MERPSFDPTTTTETPATTDVPAETAVPGEEPPAVETNPTTTVRVEQAAGSGNDVEAGEDATCLIGAWVVDDAELNAWYDVLAVNSGLGAGDRHRG